MESQVTAVIPYLTRVAMTHTKSMNGTKREFLLDSTGIALLSDSIRGFASQMLPDSPSIGY